jgi:hypothetical protein
VNGVAGTSGTSGSSGVNGAAGTSGTTGTSGTSGTRGTSGTSGVNGANGTSGINGTSGTSGVNGANGSSGTSGVNGASGSSGTTGTSGTSGTSGAQGPSGSSGTSGVSGSGSGTSGSSGTSGVNGSGGCPYEYILICSGSGSFKQNSYTSGEFFFGGDKTGWNEGVWNIIYTTTAKIPAAESFIAVPLPIDLVSGDVIKVCGIIWNSTSSDTKEYGAAISYITCSDQDGSGNYFQTNLKEDDTLGTFDSYNTGCFTLEHTMSSALGACNKLLLIGISANIGDVDNTTRFSYSCSVKHTC